MLNVLTNGFIRKGVFGFVLFSILFININWNDISIKAGKTAVVVGITLVGGTIPSAEAIVPLAAGAVMVATAIIANPGVVALGAAGIYGASTKGGEFACKDIEWWSSFFIGKIACYILWGISTLILSVLNFIVDKVLKAFNFIIAKFILEMASYFTSLFKIWSGIRDITNILVLFSAIFIGLRRILGDDLDFTKNILKVFIFALLVNFSFPISRFFIDISNLVALFISSNFGGPDGILQLVDSISHTDKIAKSVSEAAGSSWDVWGATIMAIIFMICVIITFIVAIIMIIVRVAVLVVCVVFSPLMLSTGFLGILDEWHTKWKDNYVGMLLYPPLLMLALYLTLFIITTFSSGILTLDLLLALVSFILMIKIANNLSGSLGQAVSKFATGAVKTLTLAAAGGAVGYGLRSGFGAIAGKIKGSKWVQNKRENGGFISRNVAGLLHSGADKVQNTRFKIGKYGVSDTYKDKLEKKKSVLDNRLAYLDKTDPEKALRAREALRTQGNTVGDIKNIGKIMKDDPNYLAEVNNNKAALDTKARNISNAAPDKVDGDGDIQKQRDEAAVKIRALREKRSDAGYGLDTGYNPSNNSLNNELNNNQNNQSQSTQPNRGPLTSQEEVFNRGPKTNTERVFNDGEILNNNQNNQSQSTQPNTTNNNLYPGEPITQAEIIERTNKNTGKAGFLHTPEERLTAREQLINERLNQNSQ